MPHQPILAYFHQYRKKPLLHITSLQGCNTHAALARKLGKAHTCQACLPDAHYITLGQVEFSATMEVDTGFDIAEMAQKPKTGFMIANAINKVSRQLN